MTGYYFERLLFHIAKWLYLWFRIEPRYLTRFAGVVMIMAILTLSYKVGIQEDLLPTILLSIFLIFSGLTTFIQTTPKAIEMRKEQPLPNYLYLFGSVSIWVGAFLIFFGGLATLMGIAILSYSSFAFLSVMLPHELNTTKTKE